MTFASSVSPDITEALPHAFSAREATSAAVKRGKVRFDVSIGGIGFLLHRTDDHPYQRESAPVQKEQFDASQEAGEQTLDGLWTRSQTSWHQGAGINFYEPGSRDSETLPSRYRYTSSVGIDPWTEGEIRLLKSCSRIETGAGDMDVATARLSDGTDVYFTRIGTTLKRRTAAGVATTYTDSDGFSSPDGRIAVAGAKVLTGNGFGIVAGDVGGSSLARIYTQALGTTLVPYWVKSRIIAVKGVDLYELPMVSSPGVIDGTTPKLYTHPDTGWKWTSIVEAPSAILAAGYGTGGGAIYRFSLQDASSGSTPKLSQAYQVAEFPPGEEVHSIFTYLGAYIGIGTSQGLRVGLISPEGQIQYGPLVVKTSTAVKSLSARGSFMYAAVTNAIDGKSGTVRVDLGGEISEGLLFPWAWDAQAKVTGTAYSLAFVGNTDRQVFSVSGDGVYVQSATDYETSGYLVSGSIRFGTSEPKVFRYADLRCRTELGGAVAVATVDPSGNELSLITLSQGKDGSNITLASLAPRLEYISYKLTLTRGTATVSPVVESIALKALPAPSKLRMISYPLQCVDQMTDSSGGRVGRAGYAFTLLRSLEELEEQTVVVNVEDHTCGDTYSGTIESVRFTGTTPNPGARHGHGFGGWLEVMIRRV